MRLGGWFDADRRASVSQKEEGNVSNKPFWVEPACLSPSIFCYSLNIWCLDGMRPSFI